MDRSRIPGLMLGKRHPDWALLYETVDESSLPWYSPQLDSDIKRELQPFRGKRVKVLDVGCGLGSQSHFISQLGFDVVATDISAPAVSRARTHFSGINFVQDEITDTRLKSSFDIIIDRGCFHVLEPTTHERYLKSVSSLLRTRGIFWLKCLNREGGDADFGPIRFSRIQIPLIFSEHFDCLRIHRTVYQGSSSTPPMAWFAVLRKRASHE